MVELAEAEVNANPAASRELNEFARIRKSDAEVGVFNMFKRLGLVSPIPIQHKDLEGFKGFPFLKLSDWAKFLLKTGRFAQQFVGCTLEKMPLVLNEFWERFRSQFPDHEIFGMDIDLSHAVPMQSHTDEGRSQKHEPLFVLSCHGSIGRGTRRYLQQGKHRKPLSENAMGLNFLGQTFSTQFLVCTVLRAKLNEHEGLLSEIIKLFAEDASMLAHQGINFNGTTYRLIHVGTKGDLPALAKMGNFLRTWSHVARRPSTRTPCEGICHLCLGGTEKNDRTGAVDIPYEDMRPTPIWEPSMHTVLPWETEPPILAGIPLQRSKISAFFALDLWHCFHLGVCKHFVAGALVAVTESNFFARMSMEDKFKSMTEDYVAFCKQHKLGMWITEISRDTLCFPASSAVPVGKWNKGSCSTTMMLFLDDYCSKHISGKSDDPLLVLIVTCWFNFMLLCVLCKLFNFKVVSSQRI